MCMAEVPHPPILRIFVFNILRGFCSQNIEPLRVKSQDIENKEVKGGSGRRRRVWFSVLRSPKMQKQNQERL